TNDFALARFNINGSPDTSFDGDGLVTTNIGGIDRAVDLAVQPNGKIVVLGTTSVGGTSNFAVVRYNSNGTVDTGFGNNGVRLIDFYNREDTASAVAIQGNGRIVVCGTSAVVINGNPVAFFAVARLHSDGAQDSDFDADGKVTFNFGLQLVGNVTPLSTDTLNDIAIAADGQI